MHLYFNYSISPAQLYDEAVDGELPPFCPGTSLGCVAAGLNTVSGSIVPHDLDSFNIQVPPGLVASSVVLTIDNYLEHSASDEGLARIGSSCGGADLGWVTFSQNGVFNFGALSQGEYYIHTVAGGPFGDVSFDYHWDITTVPEASSLALTVVGVIGSLIYFVQQRN